MPAPGEEPRSGRSARRIGTAQRHDVTIRGDEAAQERCTSPGQVRDRSGSGSIRPNGHSIPNTIHMVD